MAYLVTDGCGFVGANLTAERIKRGERVLVLDNLARTGAPENLRWLREFGSYEFVHGDTRNVHDLEGVFRKFDVECFFSSRGASGDDDVT